MAGRPAPGAAGVRTSRRSRQRRPTLLDLAEQAYPDPEPFDTAEQFARACHDDIAQLDNQTVYRERVLARMRWALTPAPSPWLVERMCRLDTEAERRLEERRRGRR